MPVTTRSKSAARKIPAHENPPIVHAQGVLLARAPQPGSGPTLLKVKEPPKKKQGRSKAKVTTATATIIKDSSRESSPVEIIKPPAAQPVSLPPNVRQLGKQQNYFLHVLPGEVRNRIYGYVFYHEKGHHLNPVGILARKRMALLYTCKQIRHEAASYPYIANDHIIYKQVGAELKMPTDLMGELRPNGRSNLDYVRHLRIVVEFGLQYGGTQLLADLGKLAKTVEEYQQLSIEIVMTRRSRSRFDWGGDVYLNLCTAAEAKLFTPRLYPTVHGWQEDDPCGEVIESIRRKYCGIVEKEKRYWWH